MRTAIVDVEVVRRGVTTLEEKGVVEMTVDGEVWRPNRLSFSKAIAWLQANGFQPVRHEAKLWEGTAVDRHTYQAA